MGVKVATTHYVCWSQSCSIIPQHLVPSSRTVSTWKKRCRSEGSIACRYGQGQELSALFRPASSSLGLCRSLSCDEFSKSGTQSLRRACSAAGFSVEASSSSSSRDQPSQSQSQSRHITQEYAPRFQIPDYANTAGSGSDSRDASSRIGFARQRRRPFPCFEHDGSEEPDWAGGRDEMVTASIERKANSVDLPLSLRIIKRKRRWQRGFVEGGDTACCAVEKAFSSTVFIVRELQCYTLRMREAALVCEDLQPILVRVQAEMHASFVWLFQQLFSNTPTLMVYVMILLANFTVHSMETDAAIAAPPPQNTPAVTAEAASIVETHDRPTHFEFDVSSSAMKAFEATPSSSSGNGRGGGANARAVSSDGEDESVSGQVIRSEELRLWALMVEEAKKMGALDSDTAQGLVSPVTARIEPDSNDDHLKTELLYQTALSKDPDNALLLTNFAQFLHLVVQDYDRAEVNFKRAVGVDSADAEAHSKYATFLWMVKKDLWAAEESFLEAISADPENSHHAAAYAHFLWSTGAEDTCFPLDSPDCESDDLA